MKSNSYTVYHWTSTEPDLDIDWPRVHETLGRDCVEWLMQQPTEQVQMIVEQQGMAHRLVLEFYQESAHGKFLLFRD